MLQLPDLCSVIGTVWAVVVEVEDLQGMLDIAEFLVAWFPSLTWSPQSFCALLRGVCGSPLALAHLLKRHLLVCIRLADNFFMFPGMLGARSTGDRRLCDVMCSLDIVAPLTRIAVIPPLMFALATSPTRSTVPSAVQAGVLRIVVECLSHPLSDPFLVSLLRDILPKSTVYRSGLLRLYRGFLCLHTPLNHKATTYRAEMTAEAKEQNLPSIFSEKPQLISVQRFFSWLL
ncbi:hypothetical protein K438DRAFT_2003485 [Mycena galopus ATCC 62051]|nr:hypothetical protein K438DRAFT_2003485 [Mycena galopus ATCC 62051]